MSPTLKVTVPRLPDYLVWEKQVVQYPERGEPGLGYFRGEIDEDRYVDCLLWRDEDGRVRGILNYYAFAFPPWEIAGNFMIQVDPGHRRQGVGTALLEEACRRWDLDFAQQNYTVDGAAFVNGFLRKQRGEIK